MSSRLPLLLMILCKLYIVAGQNEENNVTSPLATDSGNAVEAQTIAAPPDMDPVIERSSHFHHHVEPAFHGFWKKKFVWRPRWVKTWQEKKVYVAVWKRMWGPAVFNEWVPIAKPPPGWVKHGYHGHGGVYVKAHHY